MMGHSRTRKKIPPKQGGNLPNKKRNTFQTRENPFQTRGKTSQTRKHLPHKKNTNKQEKRLSSKGYLSIKCKSLQVVGVFGQGKVVVSDGG